MCSFKCEARERTQTYVTKTETRKKGARCALICLLVGMSGLEPPTPTLSGWCSNLLSYIPLLLVEISGLEPLTLCLQSRCSTN